VVAEREQDVEASVVGVYAGARFSEPVVALMDHAWQGLPWRSHLNRARGPGASGLRARLLLSIDMPQTHFSSGLDSFSIWSHSVFVTSGVS